MRQDMAMKCMVQQQFVFTFGGTEGSKCTVTVPVVIPLQQRVRDLVARLVQAHNLPCYVEKDLHSQLEKFVDEETRRWQDDNAEAAVATIASGKMDPQQLVDRWTRVFTQEVAKYAKPEVVTNEGVFSEVYHTLIHSPALETLMNLEHTYTLAVGQIIQQRDRDLVHLQQRQSAEMEEAVQNLGITYTDEQVNQLAQRHFDNTQLIESKWASELSNLQETQKREYRDWVMKVHEDTQATSGTPTYVQRVRALSSTMHPGDTDTDIVVQDRMEESFTIHLGAQLKTMHNLRLVRADILDLCRHKPSKIGGIIVPQPQRLQTAMSLYSNSLCAMVLLVDNRLNSYVGIKREFSKVCQQSTDFHFPDLEQQFVKIEQDITRANEWRLHQRMAEEGTTEGDKVSLKSSSSSSSTEKEDKNNKMRPGDFYISRHSNLAEVHLVYHLVTDDSVRSTDISSRHPVILGYRNILKACFRYDVHTITLPLLLVHEMSEEMTIAWCHRRAELVFKCVKGFMMELATWSGQESRTIQFLVPKALSDETFSSISNMLPSIFRMSNPVIAKTK